MNRLFFLLIFLGVASALLGQTQDDKLPQIVELKDGSRLLGTILEDNDYAVTIAILTGDTLEIGYKYISAVGPVGDSRVLRRGAAGATTLPDKAFIDDELIKIISSGFTFGEGATGGYILSFHLIKMLNDRIGIGGGLSFNTHQRFIGFNRLDMSHLPVHLSSRYILTESKSLKPYVHLDLGYGFGISTDRFDFNSQYSFNSGAYGQVQLGTTIANRKNYNMQLSLNLVYQKTSGIINGFDFNFDTPFESVFDLTLVRPGFTIGVVF